LAASTAFAGASYYLLLDTQYFVLNLMRMTNHQHFSRSRN
jgi:hypothetical protein